MGRAFGWIVWMWPARSRDWALAMQGELGEIESSGESLLWLAGGAKSLGKAWWGEVWHKRSATEPEPGGTKAPGPLAAACLLVAVALFALLPSAREGLRAVTASWSPWSATTEEAMLRRWGAEAETRHHAKTLAFFSLRMQPTAESARLADEAVALDPQLTWIYARAIDTRYSTSARQETRDWPDRLVKWDPDNAEAYLVKAGTLRPAGTIAIAYPAELAAQDVGWRTAMEKAFAAPRYESYGARRVALDREVLERRGLRQPRLVASG